ncbi:MAG: amino acid ABC transporter, partial [Rhodobacterales bacterium]|nr:amino acid ABC transporter [Rhodobacterales bacterium]
MMKRLTRTVAALALSIGLSGAASADQLADIKAAGKIVAATEMHFAPF